MYMVKDIEKQCHIKFKETPNKLYPMVEFIKAIKGNQNKHRRFHSKARA